MSETAKHQERLSKTKILSGLQCPKRLYLEVHRPELEETDEDQLTLQFGHMVGECARSLWPDGILIESASIPEAIETTRRYMQVGEPRPLFEGTFEHNGVVVKSDILVHEEEGLRLIEVKASTKLKPEHIPDVAVQAHVIENAGYPLTRIDLAHVNNTFVYTEPGNFEGLLSHEDVTADAHEILPTIPDRIREFRTALDGPEPDIAMGEQCTDPYPCPFMSYCTGEQPEFPVTSLPSGGRVARELQAEGYRDLREVPAERLSNPNHQRVHRITLAGEPELLPEAKATLDSLEYPRYYLDFESLGVPVPMWTGLRPYDAVPVQYSLHVEHSDGGLEHHEFLDPHSHPPFEALATQLIKAAGTSGHIFVYSPYEARMIRRLIELCPELEKSLQSLLDRLYDLLPLVKANYYHPEMRGSWSIKAVLPTIAPDLAYEELEDIAHGNAAQAAYLELVSGKLEGESFEKIERALRRYCAHDTHALVRLAHHLSNG